MILYILCLFAGTHVLDRINELYAEKNPLSDQMVLDLEKEFG